MTSEENQEILEQLAKEDQDSKGKKKKKSKKDKKGKKAEEASSADGENEDEEQKDDKKKKKEKKPKEKKKKDPKPIEDETPSPKLSKKKINATVFFALTILAAILLCCLVVPELFELKGARKAYYDGDYESCYKTFYGKKLSDSDKVMYEHSKMLLGIQRQVEAYNNYVAVDDELHALDVLMQAVQKQDALLNEADKQELRTEAEAAYQEILKILEEKYQLSEADAKEINAYEEDAIYTLRLKSIVEHTEFVMPEFAVPNAAEDTTEDTAEENAEEVTVEEPLEDMLPEEEMMEETTAP